MVVGRNGVHPLYLSQHCPCCGPTSLDHPLMQSLVKWESENKMVCEQRLLKGEGPKTSWTRELTNDGELILVRPASSQLRASPVLPSEIFQDIPGCRRFKNNCGWSPRLL